MMPSASASAGSRSDGGIGDDRDAGSRLALLRPRLALRRDDTGRRMPRPGRRRRRCERLRFREMDRSLWAVMVGTFTLRFSTGLTGAMLASTSPTLPEHGGPTVDAHDGRPLRGACSTSPSSSLSPLFGILSDRLGHHRVMLFGPVFGGDRGDPHRAHDEPARPRRDAHPRGRLDRRERAVDPRLHRHRDRRRRGPAGQGRGPVRGRDAGRARGRVRRRRRCCSQRSARRRSSSTRSSTASRSSSTGSASEGRRAGEAAATARTEHRVGPRAGTSILHGTRTSGCSPRPGSRSTRRSGCGSASRSSSSRRPNPRVPRPAPDAAASTPIQITLAAIASGSCSAPA